jgi:hypothetical protein
MKKMPLKDFCDKESQAAAAKIMGCTQSAVSQMIQASRDIHITVSDSGVYDCIEYRKPKAKKAA